MATLKEDIIFDALFEYFVERKRSASELRELTGLSEHDIAAIVEEGLSTIVEDLVYFMNRNEVSEGK